MISRSLPPPARSSARSDLAASKMADGATRWSRARKYGMSSTIQRRSVDPRVRAHRTRTSVNRGRTPTLIGHINRGATTFFAARRSDRCLLQRAAQTRSEIVHNGNEREALFNLAHRENSSAN